MTDFAASNRQKLLNLSRETGQSFQELVQYFAMSRFLYRLAKSGASDSFILKGALLLHALEIADARSTLDIDLLGRFSNAPEAILSVIEAAIGQEVEPDGLEFQKDSIQISVPPPFRTPSPPRRTLRRSEEITDCAAFTEKR